MSDDFEYLKKYKPDHLYTHPGAKGAYATIAGESEEVVGEIDVTSRCKLAVSAFHVHDRGILALSKSRSFNFTRRMAGARAATFR